jgi:hypothetical protein
MAKSFYDLLNQAGYRSRDASNPTVLRDIPDEGIGSGYSSESSGSDQGPSLRFMDELNQKSVKGANTLGKGQNDVRTEFHKEQRIHNPFVTPSDSPIPTTVKEATAGVRVKPETAEAVEELLNG